MGHLLVIEFFFEGHQFGRAQRPEIDHLVAGVDDFGLDLRQRFLAVGWIMEGRW